MKSFNQIVFVWVFGRFLKIVDTLKGKEKEKTRTNCEIKTKSCQNKKPAGKIFHFFFLYDILNRGFSTDFFSFNPFVSVCSEYFAIIANGFYWMETSNCFTQIISLKWNDIIEILVNRAEIRLPHKTFHHSWKQKTPFLVFYLYRICFFLSR